MHNDSLLFGSSELDLGEGKNSEKWVPLTLGIVEKYLHAKQGLNTMNSRPVLSTELSTEPAGSCSAPGTLGEVFTQRVLGLSPFLKGPSPTNCQLAWLAVNIVTGGSGSRRVNLSYYLILASCL